MQKILTISLNPALDYAVEVDEVLPDLKLRCVNPTLEPGGGGVNVSRAVALLGGESTAFVALGGATGNIMAELLCEAGIDVARFDGPGMTRQSTAVIETTTEKQYRFGQPGPEWSDEYAERALQDIDTRLEAGMWVVASGSLPPGVAQDFYVRLGQLVVTAGAKMIVDTSGAAQKAVLAQGVGLMHVLRMDQHESVHLAGHPLTTREEAARFAQTIASKESAALVIVARGADGSVFATPDRCFHWVSPKGKVVSKVGAGDSFVGGLVLGLAQGMSFEEAGRLATAAASAAVTTPVSALCPRPIVDKLLPDTLFSAL